MVEALGSVSGQNGQAAFFNLATTDRPQLQEQEIQRIEHLCRQVYESTDAVERSKAEREILELGSSPNIFELGPYLIHRASSPYSQLLGAQTLLKAVGSRPNSLSLDKKVELRTYAIWYLANQKNLAPFVVQCLTKLFAIITKLIWFDVPEAQEILPLVHQRFIGHTDDIERQIIGAVVLNQLVQEINQVNYDPFIHRSITRQRRVATNFRDEQLSDVFTLACHLLNRNLILLEENQRSPERMKLIECLLKLAISCLSFDFIGTSPDESNSDDLPTVQIPSSWRRLFVEEETVELFFRLYHRLPPDIASNAIGCLVQLTSVRRSLFNTNERYNFLIKVLDGIQGIIENPAGLSDQNTYHEFCRLLVRFKSNFQLSELTKAPNYEKWITLVRDFTCHTFQAWNSSPNSIHYLLMFWQKMVSSSNYCRGTFEHFLDTNAPKIFTSYIRYRLNGVNAVVQDGVEDPLDDSTMLQQQMDQLSYISRQCFKDSAQFLVSAFEETARKYAEIIQLSEVPEVEFDIVTGRLAWLVHIVGATLNGRLYVRGERDDPFEGDMVCLVMQLSQLSDAQLRQNRHRSEKLELAFLSFYETYRKCHLCEIGGGRIHKRLTETLQLTTDTHLYSIYITKIITNLNCWSSSEPIVRYTLEIFHELSQGFSHMHKLYDLKEIKFMLSNHTPEHFPFLNNTASIEFMRHRTSFYSSLSRHLIETMRFGNEEKFDEFLMPIDKALDQLKEVIMENSVEAVSKNEEAKRAFIGICRDVRGVAKEFVKPPSYNMLFEWIYPKYTPVLKRALEIWYNDPQATTPALRLITELVDCREKRAYHDNYSADSIYLFREVSSLIVGFGARLLTLTNIPNENIYQFKLKAVSLVFKIIQLSLRTKINYAVFQLYGDPALNDLLQMFVKLFLSIISCDILSYPKLSLQYYPLIEVLSAVHCEFILNIEPQILGCLLTSLQAGINVTDDRLSTCSFVTINNILSQLFKWLTKPQRKIGSPERMKDDDDKRKISQMILESHVQTLHSMMATMLDLLMSSEQVSHPQLPLPFLVLILLFENKFREMRDSILKSQTTPEAERIVSNWFVTLMEGVSRNLSQSNREKFIQNVLTFRRLVSEGLKVNTSLITTGLRA